MVKRRLQQVRFSCPVGEFLEWAIRDWSLIISTRFYWMTKSLAPIRPKIGFLVGMVDKFLDVWVDRDRLAKEAQLSPYEQKVLRLTRRGVPEDEARVRVDEQRANSHVLTHMRGLEEQKLREAALVIKIAARIRPIALPSRRPKEAPLIRRPLDAKV